MYTLLWHSLPNDNLVLILNYLIREPVHIVISQNNLLSLISSPHILIPRPPLIRCLWWIYTHYVSLSFWEEILLRCFRISCYLVPIIYWRLHWWVNVLQHVNILVLFYLLFLIERLMSLVWIIDRFFILNEYVSITWLEILSNFLYQLSHKFLILWILQLLSPMLHPIVKRLVGSWIFIICWPNKILPFHNTPTLVHWGIDITSFML